MKLKLKMTIQNLVPTLVMALALIACGQPGSSPSGVAQYPIAVSQVPAQAAHFQLTGSLGTIAAFDITYKPKSKSGTNKKNTRESAGCLLYSDPDGSNTLYVLLGKEKNGGKWNMMRGSVEVGDSYLKTARKEALEESGGVYDISEKVLEASSYDAYRNANIGVTFFVKVPYVAASDIQNQAHRHSNPAFKEMSAYAWVKLSDLITVAQSGVGPAIATLKTTPYGGNSTVTYRLHDYGYRLMEQAERSLIGPGAAPKAILSNLQ